MVFMPPRHGKSQLISEYFPAWYIATHPESRVMLASYAADFARTWGRKARDVVQRWGPSLYGVRVRQDSSAADEWNLADHTGGMSTAGVDGAFTGKGARILIIDDPIKNWKAAQSQKLLDDIYDFYTSTAFTRLTSDGRVIIVQTRWAENDLAGRLLEKQREDEARGVDSDRWDVINLPALAEPNDILGRPEGAALWPDGGFTVQALKRIEATEPPRQWLALYQQRPVAAKGNIIKADWLKQRYTVAPKCERIIIAVDSAWKDGVTNDYSVIAAWGTTVNGYYLLDAWRDKVELPDLCDAIQAMAEKWKVWGAYVEDKASGTGAIQILRKTTRVPVIPHEPKGSKIFRLESVSGIFRAGRVWLPDTAPWLNDWIKEHLLFPTFSHDDYCDTTSIALSELDIGEAYFTEQSLMDMEPDDNSLMSAAYADLWES